MARKSWSGAITFAGFPINVCLFPRAQSRSGDSFKQLSPHTQGPVKQQLIDSDGVVVSKAECLKGVETGKDTYKVLPEDAVEMIAAAERTTQLDPIGFPPLDTVDLTLSTGAYVVVPDPKVDGAESPTQILWNGLRESGRAMVASMTMRAGSRDTILVVHATDEGLLANTLLFAQELASDVPTFTPEPDEDAASLFSSVIESKYDTDAFAHDAITSDYAERRKAAVQAAINGETIEAPATTEAKAATPDLMAALKASLDGGAGEKPKKAPAKKKAAVA